MGRCLLVANQTLGGAALVDALRSRVDAGTKEFHVVVPATPLRDQQLAESLGAGPTQAERAHALAAQRLERALERLRAIGATADGEIGEADALAATKTALQAHPVDEVLVSTLPLGLSRWLRTDLPSRISRETGLPVDHVVSEPERS